MSRLRPAIRSSVLVALACALVLVPWRSARGAAYPANNGKLAFVEGGAIKSVSTPPPPPPPVSTEVPGPGLENPAWSPDGTRLAYDDGTNVKLTNPTTTLVLGTDPTWSKDASTIAFVASGDIWTILVSPPNTTTDLTNSSATDSQPAFSPDGSKIAFVSQVSGVDQVFVMNANGTGQQQLTLSGANDSPSWSPGGTKIAFESNRTGNWQIFSMNAADGSAQVRLTNDSGNDHHPAWSPDATTIAFDTSGGVSSIPSGGGSPPYTTWTSGADTEPDWQDAAPAPIVASPPTISPSGMPFQGQTLTTSNGSWSGSPTGYDYQWQRCTPGCADIGGETSSSYTVTSSDLSPATLRVGVCAKNVAHTTCSSPSSSVDFAYSAQTTGANGAAPVNVTLPAISGTPVANTGFLIVTVGTWTGAGITFTEQWQRCDWLTPPQCDDLKGATSTFYTPTGDDIGKRLQVVVSVTNLSGTAKATSPFSFPITGTAPKNTVSPKISGDIQVGSTLTADTGIWTGSTPLTYADQWLRCDPFGNNCAPIKGATASSYVLTDDDYGWTLRVQVTGKNGAGSGVGRSNHTLPILHKTRYGPSDTEPPIVVGVPKTRHTLAALPGTWSGEEPIAFAIQWQHCDPTGVDCTNIAGAKGTTYRLRVRDVGSTIRVLVTATNAVSTTQVPSPTSETISLSPPLPKGRRIVGTSRADYLVGGGGNDVIFGGAGNDTIYGGAGDDVIYGGAGDDVIYGGSGSNRLSGGDGNDTIYANNGEIDYIKCGSGKDRVYADAVDKVAPDCEVVTITP